MSSLFPCFSFLAVLLMTTCQQPKSNKPPEILRYFRTMTPGDTMHVEVSSTDDIAILGDSIPNGLFFSSIPQRLLSKIDHIADSSESVIIAQNTFRINDSLVACQVGIQQFWFQHYCLFLFNEKQNQFTDRVTLAEWYGGDGGQILIGSWIFDYNGDGKKDIIQHEIEHSMVPGENDVTEHIDHAVSLWLWQKDRFVKSPLPDSTAAIKRYPIQSYWE